MRTRLLASTVGIAVVVALLLGVPMAALLDRLAYDTARSQLERQAVSLGLALEPALVAGQVPTPTLLTEVAGEQQRITVVTASGLRVSGGRVEGSSITAAAPGPVGTRIIVSTADDDVREEVRRSWAALGLLAMVGTGAAAVLALAQARRFGRPLGRLRRQAERIGSGDFTAAAPRSGLPEFDAIAEALDETSARIAGLVSAERSFSANASHQLRTALTGLTLRLDLLADHADPAVREEVGAALGQADRLRRTVEDLLRLARTGRAGDRRRTDLHALAAEHVADWKDRFRAVGRALTLTGTSSIADVSPGGIGEALDVLVDNARVHGDGAVTVSVGQSRDQVVLDVADQGEGLPDGLDLFGSRRGAGGHGLGLPLARTLVEADGGSLDVVERRPPRFRITLPVHEGA